MSIYHRVYCIFTFINVWKLHVVRLLTCLDKNFLMELANMCLRQCQYITHFYLNRYWLYWPLYNVSLGAATIKHCINYWTQISIKNQKLDGKRVSSKQTHRNYIRTNKITLQGLPKTNADKNNHLTVHISRVAKHACLGVGVSARSYLFKILLSLQFCKKIQVSVLTIETTSYIEWLM